jgi:hypothetical protein
METNMLIQLYPTYLGEKQGNQPMHGISQKSWKNKWQQKQNKSYL